MLSGCSGRVRLLAGALCVLSLATACTSYPSKTPLYPDLPAGDSRELVETPFFPQDDFQCGPASLAMVLNHRGVEVTPDELRSLVYLPDKRGSLQAEMLAAASHYGQLAVRIPPSMDSLLAELSSGQPVVVLQNLGLGWLPVWHYAVVIGYDLDAGELVLRSGKDRRRVYGLDRFVSTWARADEWAMVVVPPGTVPVSATEQAYLKAASVLERHGRHAAALDAFSAASRRWPASSLAWAGAGNAAFSLGRFGDAENAYREALRLNPVAVAVMNNLALALAKRGCRRSALSAIDCAIGHAPDDANLAATRSEILETPARSASCRAFVCASAGEAP